MCGDEALCNTQGQTIDHHEAKIICGSIRNSVIYWGTLTALATYYLI